MRESWAGFIDERFGECNGDFPATILLGRDQPLHSLTSPSHGRKIQRTVIGQTISHYRIIEARWRRNGCCL